MRVSSDKLPVYAKSDSPCWKVPGLKISSREESFKASPKGSDEKVELKATYSQVSFDSNLDIATKFFGSVEKLLSEAESSVNDWLQIQGKNKAKADQLGFAQKIADNFNAAIAKFVEVRGSQPTDAQKTAIRAKVVARLEELERLSRETVDLTEV